MALIVEFLVHLLAFAVLNARFSLAQTVISNTIPQCGQQCPLLIQAQQACVPPAAPLTNQQAYTSCFCQFATLAPMYGGTITGFCPACTADDMTATQNWFKGLCPDQGKGVAGSGTPTSTFATSSTINAATLRTTNPSTDGTKGGLNQGPSGQSDGPPGSWISTHWRWVIMLIVLFFGLSLLAFGMWYLRRRYHRRKEAEIRRLAGDPADLGSWGPGQSVHDISSPAVLGTPSGQSEKGKERDGAANVAASGDTPSQGRRMRESMRESKRTSRLRKAFL